MKIESLTREYDNWLKENNLPDMSADELVSETDDNDEYIATAEQRAWLYNFINRWEKAEQADKPEPKFFYSPETNTLYYLEDDFLCGIPQYQDGTFSMEDSFVVEEHNEMLGNEDVTATRPLTLSDVWAEAREALSK